jgi:hypothetical protein
LEEAFSLKRKLNFRPRSEDQTRNNKFDIINAFILFQQPFHCEIEHKLGLTCLTTGPVTCRVRLDRSVIKKAGQVEHEIGLTCLIKGRPPVGSG